MHVITGQNLHNKQIVYEVIIKFIKNNIFSERTILIFTVFHFIVINNWYFSLQI